MFRSKADEEIPRFGPVLPRSPGPRPEIEEETGAQCRFCGRTAAGPPEPYCCAGRKRLDLKINAGEHPIFPGPANDQDDE
jgi:hypothetical protein